MASEAEILAARRQRAERLRERGVELFPARVHEGQYPMLRRRRGVNARENEDVAVEALRVIPGLLRFGRALC